MSSLEFTYWREFFLAEPWGYEMENFRAGLVAATIANVAPRKKGAKPLKPSDFYPISNKPPQMSSRFQQQLEERRKRKRKK